MRKQQSSNFAKKKVQLKVNKLGQVIRNDFAKKIGLKLCFEVKIYSVF